jgi:hypothetical protein
MWTPRRSEAIQRRSSDLLTRYATWRRLDTATPAEKVGIVHDLVQSIDVEAERDQAGCPIFHYEKRHRADGSYR